MKTFFFKKLDKFDGKIQKRKIGWGKNCRKNSKKQKIVQKLNTTEKQKK